MARSRIVTRADFTCFTRVESHFRNGPGGREAIGSGKRVAIGNQREISWSSAEVDRIPQQGRISDQSGGRRRLAEGATVWLPKAMVELVKPI